ncbi:MAG: integrase [Acidobacteria bacterium]|nr:MAG: integrase [Acidobacteriota bacterium]
MLSSEELRSWYERLNLSPETRSVIDQVRSSEPARRVGGGRRNVHRVELAGIYEMEHDDSVEEFYDQPPSFRLDYVSAEGRHLGVRHTPDFFVIRQDTAGWEEWKTEEELVRLAEKSPHRYRLENGNHWRCPPGEEYAHLLGLYYRVRSSGEINWVFQRNMQFLEDYLRSDSFPIPPLARERVRAYVFAWPGVNLQALLEDSAGITAPDDIYSLIATGQLYVDLNAEPLAEPEKVKLFGCRHAALTCSPPPQERLSQNSCDPALQGSCASTPLTPNPAASDVIKKLLDASEEDLRVANQRSEIVRHHLKGDPPPAAEPTPPRTLRRWLLEYRAANRFWGTGYVGLLPRPRPGNCVPRLSENSVQLLNEVIETEYETKKQKNRYACWIWLQRACEQAGVRTPSYMTFCTAVRKRAGFEQTLKRKGHRAAYPQEPFYFELELKTPRHGDRPFEICHIDHTELDIELVCSHTRQNLGRPWYTILTDAFSRRLLAIYLTFDPPSYRCCMMVLRECVRRHGRFPQSLVVDGGKEFGSVYFDTLLARFECTKKTRPPAKARFGSVCERLFGTSNTRFIHNLAGNTQIMKNIRQVTKSVNPKRHAEWTLAELYEGLCQWAYEVYDTVSHPAHGQTPREAFAAGLAQSGIRPHRMIAYDEEFRLWTLPTTVRGQARVVPGKGVKINHVFYWAAALRDPEVERTLVPVRYDPYDAGVSYTFVRNRWVQCVSEHYSALRGRSERELMLATAELRRRTHHHAGQFTVTAKKLADFLASAEGDHVLKAQRTKDQEAKGIVTTIQAGLDELRCDTVVESEIPTRDSVAMTLAVEARAKTLSVDDLTTYEEY